MDSGRATFDAFDGVEIGLVGGRVLTVPAFTVADSARFVRMWSKIMDGEHELIEEFVRAFVERAGLGSVTLDELGVEGVSCGGLTLGEVHDLLGVLHAASWDEDERVRSRAQLRWLDEAPGRLGTDEADPAKLFEAGQSFARDYYLHMYGLASDFCSRLHLSPRVRTWAVRGASQTLAAGTPT